MSSGSSKSADKKRVLILSLGGTLGMRPASTGTLRPDAVLQDLFKWVPELEGYASVHMEILANLDSSLMGPSHWLSLAQRIEKAQADERYDGIAVLQGTDTLAYTASALSFLLLNVGIPVVVTGAQRPLAVTRTDARNNILGAVEAAIEGPVEVMVFFNHKVYRGNRVTKVAISDFHGFDSPNFPLLGSAGLAWEWNEELFWPPTRRPPIWRALPEDMPSAPLVLPWVPGLSFDSLEPALSEQWALILEAFGTGNMPLAPGVRASLTRFIAAGGLVFVKSQVTRGRTSLEAYEPGRTFAELGVGSGLDMTRESLVTKLMVLKALKLKSGEIYHYMGQNLAGELNPPRK